MLATGSDKGCETIGLSVIREDQAALSFGTSCTVQFTTRKYFEPTPFMPAYPAVPNDMYNPEIQILRGYWMLTWFKQNFAQAEVEAAKALVARGKAKPENHPNAKRLPELWVTLSACRSDEVNVEMKNPAVRVLRSTGYLTYGLVSMAVRYARK